MQLHYVIRSVNQDQVSYCSDMSHPSLLPFFGLMHTTSSDILLTYFLDHQKYYFPQAHTVFPYELYP